MPPRIGAEQVPAVPFQVKKHGDLAVFFHARLRGEANSTVQHVLVRGLKVIDAQEKSDAARKLLPDRSNLAFAISTPMICSTVT